MLERVLRSRSEHAGLIDGLSTLYSTLVDMCYLETDDVHFPQAGTESTQIDTAYLETAGFGEDAITLIEQLSGPSGRILHRWASSEAGIPLAPGSQAVSYVSDTVPDLQDMRYIRNGEVEIGENDFKISRCGGTTGEDRIYRFAEKGLEVIPLQYDSDGPHAHLQPIAEALSDWDTKFRTLEWLPWSDGNGLYIEQQPTEWDRDQADPTNVRSQYQIQHTAWQQAGLPMAQKSVQQLLLEHTERTRAERNKYWAKRRIYEDAGWPDAFDREEFRRQRDRWNQQYNEVTDLYRHGPKASRYWEFEHGQMLREMFRSTAGRYAV